MGVPAPSRSFSTVFNASIIILTIVKIQIKQTYVRMIGYKTIFRSRFYCIKQSKTCNLRQDMKGAVQYQGFLVMNILGVIFLLKLSNSTFTKLSKTKFCHMTKIIL